MAGARGGRRTGAGRPAILNFDQMIAVGSLCENAWNQERRDVGFGNFEASAARPKEMRTRRTAIRPGESKLMPPPSCDEIKAIEDAGAKVFGIQKRTYRVKLPRPHGGGVKSHIVDEAIAYALDRWSVTISRRMVRTCWQQYRNFLRTVPDR